MYKFLLTLSIIPSIVFAQNHNNENEEIEDFKRHKISFVMGQTYIPKVFINNYELASAHFIPTDGIEYQYNFSEKLYIKAAAEIEFQTYFVKKFDNTTYKRENSFILTTSVGYEFYDRLSVFAGGGYEIEKSKNLWVTRFGLEYNLIFYDGWSISPTFNFDYKAESHFAYSLALSVGRIF